LSSTVTDDNELLTVDLTNPDIESRGATLLLPRGHLHVFRAKFLWRGSCHERIRISNFALRPVETDVTLSFDADYCDVFEVRGARRERRGHRLAGRMTADEIVLGYEGLDGTARHTRLGFQPAPTSLTEGRARFELHLPPGESFLLHVTTDCALGTGDQIGFGAR